MASDGQPAANVGEVRLPEVTELLIAWGREHRAAYPWRDGEVALWQKLVAEVMLLRTNARQVVRVWTEFVQTCPDVVTLSSTDSDELKELFLPLGLKWRISLLIKLLDRLVELGGVVPLDYAELTALPGVGPYCASAFLSLHADRYAVLIDTNTVRVLSRVVGREYDGETRRRAWLRRLATAQTPTTAFRDFNYGILDVGMQLCRPRPLCTECPLSKNCQFARTQDATRSPSIMRSTT